MKKTKDMLILIPTYNEKGNVKKLLQKILGLKLKNTDILFIDDNSPDGTGRILENLSKSIKHLKVIHRKGKSGIGSAHLYGIDYAYKKGYNILITMDADLTHDPKDILKLLEKLENADVVFGSRFMSKEGMGNMRVDRKIISGGGHFLTKLLLNRNYDFSNAFRAYDLSKINKKVFEKIKSRDYAFFQESLFLLDVNGYSIKCVATQLSRRSKGKSKMTMESLIVRLYLLARLFIKKVLLRNSLLVKDEKKK